MTTNLKGLALFALAVSLPFLEGCTICNEECDSDTDGDTGYSTGFRAVLTIVLPEFVPDDVEVFVNDDLVPCDLATHECVFVRKTSGGAGVRIDCEGLAFIEKGVGMYESGGEYTVDWTVAGGCNDEGWTPESHTTCASWTPGEWGLAPNGTYLWIEEYENVEITADNSPDVTGDGIADIVIEFDGSNQWPTMTVAGNRFYGINGNLVSSGNIASDLSVVERYAHNGESPADSTFERQ